jgi:hypothetical protein
METFYLFVMVYTLQNHEITIRVPLETAAQCQIAIRANEPLSNELNADLYCIDTGRISKSIRPKLRP